VLTTTQPHVALTGGAGADTLTAGPGYDTLTGGAGADHFVLKTEPWAPITIGDFQPGTDKIDLSAMFKAAGYTGTNPIADGYMYVQSDGAGGSILRFDHDGHGPNPVWPNTIVDLVGVAPGAVKMSDWIIH
jgi:Ca2+-binding RTX toxin-like protein